MGRGTRASKEVKRLAVAKKLVEGKRPPTIAKEVGCSIHHVQKLEVEPETQALIQRMMAPHHRRLKEMAERAVNAVDEGLAALHDDPADHKSRMQAVQRYGDLLELAQGGQRSGEQGAGGTHYTLYQIMQAIQIKEEGKDDA